MTTIHRSPQPKIEIFTYDAPDQPVYTLSPLTSGYTQLLDYSFSERIGDLTGAFSFSIAGGDNNLFNEIQPLNIVKIYEGAAEASFIGIITTRHLSCAMSESGVRRRISFSGKSITSLIAEFQLILDIKFLQVLNVTDATELNIDLKIEKLNASSPLTVEQFLNITWEAYLGYTGIAGRAKGGSNFRVYQIIKNFLGDSFFEVGTAAPLPIPIANSFFNQDINTVLQIWQTILAPPVYEIFSRVNKDGKPKIVVRESPFDSEHWKSLTAWTVPAELLIDYSLRLSNEEVYTAFLGYIEGSELSADQYVIIEQTDTGKRKKELLKIDDEKFSLYGLKMCRVGFRGYHKEKQEFVKTEDAMAKMGARLQKWFGRLDEMYSANATIINPFNGNGASVPHCGQRLIFLGGEFYIQGVEHRWNYGGQATVTVSLNRGGHYDINGNFTGTLSNMGASGIELEPAVNMQSSVPSFLNR